MRQRLAEREGGLVAVELTTEHHRQEIGRAVRPLAGGDRLGAARLVMRRELIDPRMDAAERQIVRRQDQRVGRQRVAEFPERAQIARQRIALGLVRRDADIGRDLRQDLVAGNQNAGLGAIEAGELRRMAFADNDPPTPSADLDLAPVTDPVIGRRHRGHAAPVACVAHGKDVARLLVEPGALGKGARRLRIIGGAVAGHHARVQPLFLGDPQGRLPTLGEPAGKPDMVGMVMGDDDPPHRPAAEIGGKELLPEPGLGAPAKPQSTIVQPGPSSKSHRLMWLSAKGSGMRSHRTPGAIRFVSPGAGGAATGNSSISAMRLGNWAGSRIDP